MDVRRGAPKVLTIILIFNNVSSSNNIKCGNAKAMYVCICNGITDKQIRKAVAGGANSLQELRDELGVGSQCGSCTDYAMTLLDDGQLRRSVDESLFYSLA